MGKLDQRGNPIPKSLYPLFCGEEELLADADLSANISRALERSSLLVVLCSPQSVASMFVAEEIQYFKDLDHADRIWVLMIDGEPKAVNDPHKQRSGTYWSYFYD